VRFTKGIEAAFCGFSARAVDLRGIAYSFQSLTPNVNNLQTFSITYTYSQQLSGDGLFRCRPTADSSATETAASE
jgi:hypothetical protein